MGQISCSNLIYKVKLVRPKFLNTLLCKSLSNNKYYHVSSHLLRPLIPTLMSQKSLFLSYYCFKFMLLCSMI